YDKQEQRSLATSLHNRLFHYQRVITDTFYRLQSAPWASWRQPVLVILAILLLLLTTVFILRLKRMGWSGFKTSRRQKETELASVEFYRRLTRVLAERGINRAADQTPLEFAAETGLELPVRITHAYHRVRYGSQSLSPREAKEIEGWLNEMERDAKS
ncbi:MAG TPA: DUF4129 domain-containing protein, partial [Pyrinomonadaceae bacterium]|nr:DUF4129 domain-containing protein [Pyrinomonadaceae bacterium]